MHCDLANSAICLRSTLARFLVGWESIAHTHVHAFSHVCRFYNCWHNNKWFGDRFASREIETVLENPVSFESKIMFSSLCIDLVYKQAKSNQTLVPVFFTLQCTEITHVSPFFHPCLSKHTELAHLQTEMATRIIDLERNRLLFLTSTVRTAPLPAVITLSSARQQVPM